MAYIYTNKIGSQMGSPEDLQCETCKREREYMVLDSDRDWHNFCGHCLPKEAWNLPPEPVER